MGFLEFLAAALTLADVVLLGRKNILGWPIGLLGIILYGYVFYVSELYVYVALYIYFFGGQLYGWYYWKTSKARDEIIIVRRLAPVEWLCGMLLVAFGTICLGFSMEIIFGAKLAYLTAFTSSIYILSQFLMARHVLENWLLWIVGDLVSIGIFIDHGFYFSAGFFAVIIFFSALGFRDWLKHPRKQNILREDK